MGFLDGFEKLINEHGSATILKERIALANDKYSALEKELSTFKAREAELAAENQSLKLDNEKFRQEIQRRDDECEKKKSHKTPLDGPKVKILEYLSEYDASTTDEVAVGLNIKLQLVKYHLEELYKSHMVDQEHNPLGSNWWSLKQAGRKYLIVTGILA
jgi:regulator of replication initiation timing